MRKMGLVLSAAALLWMAVGCASARDAGPKISYDGRAATVCNSVPQWQIKHLCVLPMPRLVAFPVPLTRVDQTRAAALCRE